MANNGQKKAKPKSSKLKKYIKENPWEAASIAAMAVPVVGWGAAAGLRTVALGSRAWKARGAIKTAAKKAVSKVKAGAKKVKEKTGPARKKIGSKLRTTFGPKHKKGDKIYTSRQRAEMGRAGSKQHKVVRKQDKVTKGYKGKEVRKKQYKIEPTTRAAATSKKAIFTYGATSYAASQLMSDKTYAKKPSGNGKKKGGSGGKKGPGSVSSNQGKGTGSWRNRPSAGPNAIAVSPKRRGGGGKVNRQPPKYRNGTGGGDRVTKSIGPKNLSERFRRRLGGMRKPGGGTY
tara:strand:+ start:186 stop:1049 length:864 start_codon:yes stop_codon:yes gene_type:complete